MKKENYRYRCPHCRRVLWRESGKAWVKSYCVQSGTMARLQRVK